MLTLPFTRKSDFRSKSTETHKGIQAMDEAMTEISLKCNPADSSRALYLVKAPAEEMSMDLIKEIGDYLRSIAPAATIMNGDYPRGGSILEVTIVLSGLSDVEKIREYYGRTIALIPEFERRQQETESRLQALDEEGKDIPSLL